MATVNTTWVNPAGAVLDLASGVALPETATDGWSSNFYHLGGTTGYIAGGAHQAATQSVSDSSSTIVLLGAEHMDADPNGAVHDNVTNSGRMTIRTTGVYHLGAWLQWASNATGYRHSSIRHNGATALAQDVRAAVSGTTTEISLYRAYPMTAGDYVEVVVIQTSGGALTLSAACLTAVKA